MEGAQRDRYEAYRAELLKALAYTEALIDFGEDAEDITSDALAEAVEKMRALRLELEALVMVRDSICRMDRILISRLELGGMFGHESTDLIFRIFFSPLFRRKESQSAGTSPPRHRHGLSHG